MLVSFEKKLVFVSKIVKSGKFAVECASKGIVSRKCLLYFNFDVFGKKSKKKLHTNDNTKFDEEYF